MIQSRSPAIFLGLCRRQRLKPVFLAAEAIAKARQLAAQRGVSVDSEQADLTRWIWPEAAYDAVVAIFIQFLAPDERVGFFLGMKRALKPGGLLLLEDYRPGQLEYRTGRPGETDNLYAEAILRQAFADMDIVTLRACDAVIIDPARAVLEPERKR